MNKNVKRVGYVLSAAGIAAAGFIGVPVFADAVNCSAEPTGDSCIAANVADLTAGINNPSIKTITLGGDVISNVEVSIRRNLAIDLGGHKLSMSTANHTIKVYNEARLELSNGAVEGNNGRSAIFNNGIVEANRVNFTINESASSKFYVITNHGDMELNDCTAKRTTSGAASVVENGYADYGNKTGKAAGEAKGYVEGENGQYPNLTINGGDYTVVSGGGVEVIKTDDGGETYINDGTFSSDENTTGWLLQLSGRLLNITGGTFTSKDPSVGDIILHYCMGDEVNTCNLDIAGGTFNAPQNLFDNIDNSVVNATITASGGTYRNDQIGDYLAEGATLYNFSTDEEARYVILGSIDVEPAEDEEMEKPAEQTAVEDFVAGQIETIINDGDYELDDEGIADTGKIRIDLEALQDALMNGQTINVGYDQFEGDVESYLDSEENQDEIADILEAAGENAQIGGLFYGEIYIYAGDTPIGMVYALDEDVTLSYELSEELATAPEGYIRKFAIVRYHQGVATKLETTQNGNVLSAKNNEFSTFVVTYEDTEEDASESTTEPTTNPNTFDGSRVAFAAGVGASLVTMTWGIYLALKKQ